LAGRFENNLWNPYEHVKKFPVVDNASTNNFVEGWNNGFNSLLQTSKPDFWNFVEAVKADIARTKVTIAQIEVNDLQPNKSKTVHESAVRIKAAVDRYRRKSGDSGMIG
jgi:hypothetical protein